MLLGSKPQASHRTGARCCCTACLCGGLGPPPPSCRLCCCCPCRCCCPCPCRCPCRCGRCWLDAAAGTLHPGNSPISAADAVASARGTNGSCSPMASCCACSRLLPLKAASLSASAMPLSQADCMLAPVRKHSTPHGLYDCTWPAPPNPACHAHNHRKCWIEH